MAEAKARAGALSLLSFPAHQPRPELTSASDARREAAILSLCRPSSLIAMATTSAMLSRRLSMARAYLPANDPAIERELTTRLVAEGLMRS